jgi:hypothetical protein
MYLVWPIFIQIHAATFLSFFPGILLNKDERNGTAWLYNRTSSALFISSPTFNTPNTRQFNVVKVPSGFSVPFFDYAKSREDERIRVDTNDGPFDPYSVHVSFHKGWGGAPYKRTDVLQCPCWLRITMAEAEDDYRNT